MKDLELDTPRKMENSW